MSVDQTICPKPNVIFVTVETSIPDQPTDNDDGYIFVYTVTIHNNSPERIQLLNRYWLITDANDEKTEVVGEGVIGKQPFIESNDSFTYSSYCILKTPVGTMEGHYGVIDKSNKVSDIAITPFSLALPNIMH